MNWFSYWFIKLMNKRIKNNNFKSVTLILDTSEVRAGIKQDRIF